MGDKEGKWREHLKAGEAAALTLNGYAKSNRINVQGLYEARRLRAQRAGVGWAVVRVTPDPSVEVGLEARECAAPTAVSMQARLGNGVLLSWSHDQSSADAPSSVLSALAALPCFV